MAAGMYIQVQIWRMASMPDDDYVGGASISGSVVYTGIQARMSAMEEEQLVLQQGLETKRVFRFTLAGSYTIWERDEIEVTAPCNHPYANSKFRIISVRYSDYVPGDPRDYMILLANRSVRAHSQQ